MSAYQNFEEEEDALFANEDGTSASQSKGLRTVPRHRTVDFIAWLGDYYPQIRSVHDLNRQNMQSLVSNFENATGAFSNYTPEEWLATLRQQSPF